MSKFSKERSGAYKNRDWNKVIKYGEMELEQDPHNIKVLNDLSCAYFKKKNYDRALVLCESIRKLMLSVDMAAQSEELAHEITKKGGYNIRYVGLFELRNITGVHKIYEVMSPQKK